GFFFRATLGYARAGGTMENSDTSWNSYEERYQTKTQSFDVSGGGANVELMFGGTPAPGLVLGIGGRGIDIPEAKLQRTDSDSESSSTVHGVLSAPHAFLLLYPDPLQGLHLGLSVGYGVARLVDENGEEQGDAMTGAVLGGGVGYEGWVGEQWSMGVFGQLLYAPLTNDETDGSLLIPTVSLIVTDH